MDVDGDGAVDLVSAQAVGVVAYQNLGQGRFFRVEVDPTRARPSHVDVAPDYDGQGIMLVVTYPRAPELVLYTSVPGQPWNFTARTLDQSLSFDFAVFGKFDSRRRLDVLAVSPCDGANPKKRKWSEAN